MWFHGPFRADGQPKLAATTTNGARTEWMLFDMSSPTGCGVRGLNFGHLYQNGKLVLSVSQEILLRLNRDRNA